VTHTGEWDGLQRLIDEAEASGGTVGVAIVGSAGQEFRHNAERRFRAASTVKIPIMIQIFRRIDRGELALAQEYTVRAEDHSVGSGVLHDMHTGLVVTIHDLLYLMMSISDNTATNILIDLAGMEEVNAVMRELGMEQSELGRKMQGRPAEGTQAENWATAREYAQLVQKLLDGDVASAGSCTKMVAILEQQQNGRRIGRYLPDEGVRWGSKTGSISGVTNDVGFVTSDAGTVVVSVFCENLADQHVGEQFIGDVARQAVAVCGIAEPLQTS
jgi:beta-lactamase class A